MKHLFTYDQLVQFSSGYVHREVTAYYHDEEERRYVSVHTEVTPKEKYVDILEELPSSILTFETVSYMDVLFALKKINPALKAELENLILSLTNQIE